MNLVTGDASEAEMISEATLFHACDSLDRVFREKLFVSACKKVML